MYLSDLASDQWGEEEDKVTWPRRILATSEPLSQGPVQPLWVFSMKPGEVSSASPGPLPAGTGSGEPCTDAYVD